MKEVIMDHYEHPRHNVLLNNPEYITVRLKNPSCGDDLTVQCEFSGRGDTAELADIRQKGSGCSICLASASMMAEQLEGHDIKFVKTALANFSHMLQADPYNPEVLGDAQALKGISRVLPRIKCANLAWQALTHAVSAYENKKSATQQVNPTAIDLAVNE